MSAVVANPAPIAILSALAEEQVGLIEALESPLQVVHAGRAFWCGRLWGQPVVLALSRIGKVAAATTAVTLIEAFAVDRIVFTGVAGGVADGVKVGDVVVGRTLMQHDMDASPLFPRYEVPLYGQTVFDADPHLSACLQQACAQSRDVSPTIEVINIEPELACRKAFARALLRNEIGRCSKTRLEHNLAIQHNKRRFIFKFIKRWNFLFAGHFLKPQLLEP